MDEDPLDDVGLLLTLAGVEAVRNLTMTLADLGFNPRSFTVLRMAAATPGITQRDLAERLALNPSRLVGIVDDLEARGLLGRTVDGRDRRARVLHVTPGGLAELAAAGPAVEEALDHTLAGLTPAGRDDLRALLRSVVQGSKPLSRGADPGAEQRSP